MATPKVLAFRTFRFPDNAPATQRFGSFCRYLSEAGYAVTLLALGHAPGKSGAPPELAPEPSFRTVLLPWTPPNPTWLRLRRLLEKYCPRLEGRERQNSLILRTASNLVRQDKYDCVLTTYMPIGSLRVADRLRRQFPIPWIADLRDLPDQFDPERRSRLARCRAGMLARHCRSAAHWTTVSPPLKAALEERYAPPCPVSVIYNGFEAAEFADLPDPGMTEYFDIAYFGQVYAGRSFELLQAALNSLAGRGINLSGLRVLVYGKTPREGWGLREDAVSASLFTPMGQVGRREALGAMRRSAILLSLASPGAKGILTSKIFEYALVGRPVLSIPADHDVLDEFVSRARIGLSADSTAEAADFIARHLEAWRRTRHLPVTTPEAAYLGRFSRRNQALELASIVEGVAKQHPAPQGHA